MYVGGLPAMSHFSFEHENPLALKALFVQLMLDKGFLATTAYYAMAAHRPENVAAYLDAVDAVFAEMAPVIAEKSVMQKLKGQPASAGFKRLTIRDASRLVLGTVQLGLPYGIANCSGRPDPAAPFHPRNELSACLQSTKNRFNIGCLKIHIHCFPEIFRRSRRAFIKVRFIVLEFFVRN